MRIDSISAENFRSFGKRTEIPLGQLTLLIGPNNAGKSNILRMLTTLHDRVSDQPGRTQLHPLPGQADLIRTGTPHSDIRVSFSEQGRRGSYGLRIVASGSCSGEYEAWDGPKLALSLGDPRTLGSSVPSAGALATLIRGYEVWRFDPEHFFPATQVAARTLMGSRGEHAAAVLDHLRDLAPRSYQALQEDLRRCAPEVDRAVAAAASPGNKEIVFVEQGGAQFRCHQASEGLQCLLFFLLILHSPTPPQILAFEEIEHGLHPRRIKDVIGFLRQLTQRPSSPQILLTTHSPLVLDEFRDVPEQVLAVERGPDGASTVTQLSHRLAQLKGVDPGTPLGELWYSGVLGGVPSR